MRSDLIGMPVVRKSENKIWIIRAAWIGEGEMVWMLVENENGELQTVQHNQVRSLVPQVMSSYSATSLTELFPDLLMEFGRREILAIWTLSLGFDGPLREKIKYGIIAFKEGKEGELAAMRAQRDAGGFDAEPEPTLRSELMKELRAGVMEDLQKHGMLAEGVYQDFLNDPSRLETGIEPWNPELPGAHRYDKRTAADGGEIRLPKTEE